jgi:hypothetical protein
MAAGLPVMSLGFTGMVFLVAFCLAGMSPFLVMHVRAEMEKSATDEKGDYFFHNGYSFMFQNITVEN